MATTLTEIMMNQKQAHIQIQANYCLASIERQESTNGLGNGLRILI
jgi:hypothetical protein